MAERILITGGTGLVGTALTQALVAKGYAVTILTRKNKSFDPGQQISYAHWDIKQSLINPRAIDTADHIIHLAGAGVAEKRWTPERKKEIRDSRVHSSELLVRSLATLPNTVKTVVSASAIGWYGPDPGKPFTGFIETDPADPGFLGTTSKEWEASIEPVTALGKRLVKIRVGIVLANEGGAFPAFLRSFPFGVKAILGSGKQYVSWIHIQDLVTIFIKAIEDNRMQGAYNGVAPQAITHRELMNTIAEVKGGRYIPVRIPGFFLKIGLGEMSIEVLKSTWVIPQRLHELNHIYQFPTIGSAISDLLKR